MDLGDLTPFHEALRPWWSERERERETETETEQRILTEIQSVPGDLYISHHITSHHVISYHVMSYHIISYLLYIYYKLHI